MSEETTMRCDRCRKRIVEDTGAFRGSSLNVSKWVELTSRAERRFCSTVDLCDSCTKAFDKFMRKVT